MATELERFRKRTRWVYYRNGVAYGPLTPDEVFTLIRKQELDGAIEMMELGSERRAPLASVSFFAEVLREVEVHVAAAREEKEFEKARTTLGSSHTKKFVLVNVMIPVVLLLALGVGLWFAVFGRGTAEDAGPVMLAEDNRPLPPARAVAKVEEPSPEPAASSTIIKEAEGEAVLDKKVQDYALKILADGNRNAEGDGPKVVADGGERKLPTVKLDRKVREKREAKKKGGEAGAEDDGTMAFSEDELASGADVEEIVTDRLIPVVDECRSRLRTAEGGEVSLTVRVTVKPGGQLSSLRVSSQPETQITDARMCIQAGMASIRVEPFEGAPKEIELVR